MDVPRIGGGMEGQPMPWRRALRMNRLGYSCVVGFTTLGLLYGTLLEYLGNRNELIQAEQSAECLDAMSVAYTTSADTVRIDLTHAPEEVLDDCGPDIRAALRRTPSNDSDVTSVTLDRPEIRDDIRTNTQNGEDFNENSMLVGLGTGVALSAFVVWQGAVSRRLDSTRPDWQP